MKTNSYGIKEIIKKTFSFTQMFEIARIGEGGSIGEYALLRNTKRSASVRTLEETHFATMDRMAFEEIMYPIKKKEADEIVKFMSKN